MRTPHAHSWPTRLKHTRIRRCPCRQRHAALPHTPMPACNSQHSCPDQTRDATLLADPQATSRITAHIPYRRVRSAALSTCAVPLHVLMTELITPCARVRLRATGTADSHRRHRLGRATTACAPLAARLAAGRCRCRVTPRAAALTPCEGRSRWLHATTAPRGAHSTCYELLSTAERHAIRDARQHRHIAIGACGHRTPDVCADEWEGAEEDAATPLFFKLGRPLHHLGLGSSPWPSSSNLPLLLPSNRPTVCTSVRWKVSGRRAMAGGAFTRCSGRPCCRRASHISCSRSCRAEVAVLNLTLRNCRGKKSSTPSGGEKPSICEQQAERLDVSERGPARVLLDRPACPGRRRAAQQSLQPTHARLK